MDLRCSRSAVHIDCKSCCKSYFKSYQHMTYNIIVSICVLYNKISGSDNGYERK